MRKWILAAALVASLIARPAMADDLDELVFGYGHAAPLAPVCKFLKYDVDEDGLNTAANGFFQALNATMPKIGKDAVSMKGTVTELAATEMRLLNPGDLTNFPDALNLVFNSENSECKAFSEDKTLSAYIKPSTYSQSGLPQTAMGWIDFYANAGDNLLAEQMAVMYVKGANGLPRDRHMGMVWFEKAAENGDVVAMTTICEARLVGEDMPKDRIAAAKWCYLARKLEDVMGPEVAPLESQLTPDELAAGQKLGDVWLAAHPAAQSAQ